MLLSIITINRNNAAGLRRTMESVLSQTRNDIEYIIIDGASTDGSVEVIKALTGIPEPNAAPAATPSVSTVSPSAASPATPSASATGGMLIRWLSEPDSGIYNAMNKGIRLATGDYIQILNSGDCLASDMVVRQMLETLEGLNLSRQTALQDAVDILYGNMIRGELKGKYTARSGRTDSSLLQFYLSTLNHDCCYIRRSLFEKYGYYDETLQIVSDWKWFMQVIGLGNVEPIYTDIDVTLFDLGGISESQLELRRMERRRVLEEVVPPAVLADYDRYAFPMTQIRRLQRHHLYGVVWFMERVLFKLEKWRLLRR